MRNLWLAIAITGLAPALLLGQAEAGEAEVGYLGIQFRLVEDGLLVTGVNAGTPAEAQGLRAGDVIVRYDGVDLAAIETTEAFLRHFAYLRAGASVEAVVRSGAEIRTMTWVLGKRPGRVARLHEARMRPALLQAGLTGLHPVTSPAIRAGQPVGLQVIDGTLSIGAPAVGVPFQALGEPERFVIGHVWEEGYLALEAAARPGACVRLWFEAPPGRFAITRHEAVPNAAGNCP